MFVGRKKTGRSGCKFAPLQTALNKRPGAETNRGMVWVGAGVKTGILTSDGPKWTARSGEGSGEVKFE